MKTIEELGISPIPWSLVVDPEYGDIEVSDGTDHTIAQVFSWEPKADASFIAAAPKMYEKAYSVLDNLLVHLQWPGETISMNRAEVAAMAKELQDALAEASGEVSND